jgi:HEAT repeat protein
VPAVIKLADNEDELVADAAVRALGNVADEPATAFLLARTDAVNPGTLATALLRCANAMAASGKAEQAEAIYRKLSEAGQPTGARLAAFEALLAMQKTPIGATVTQWLAADDAVQRRVAARHLDALSDAELDALLDRMNSLDEATQTTLLQVSVERKGGEMLQLATELAKSENEGMKRAGVRLLGQTGDPAAIPILMDALAAGGLVTDAARDALMQLPRGEVAPALLAALAERPASRVPVIDILARTRNYEAIDAIIELAGQDAPETYGPALDGLRVICDPDKSDIPRLVKLLLRSESGQHADEVEKTILVVCDKLPADADRSALVLESLRGVPESQAPKYLPLLGRLGGSEARKRIDAGLASADPAVKEAAVRALCNWPNAEVADQLLEIAKNDDNRTFKRWALRAFIRVVSLKSDRPESETLALLQEAMRLAENDEDRQLVLERAGNVRTMDAVNWIAPYLDDPKLAQAACRALVELAHHRFLRHPNMDRFSPLLKRIAKISTDPAIVERAARYEQGL